MEVLNEVKNLENRILQGLQLSTFLEQNEENTTMFEEKSNATSRYSFQVDMIKMIKNIQIELNTLNIIKTLLQMKVRLLIYRDITP